MTPSASRRLQWTTACAIAALSGVAFAGCRGAAVAPVVAQPVAVVPAPGPEKPSFDPCVGSKPIPHAYSGVLHEAKCEQEMFLTMASTADQLGVECRFCHLPLLDNGKEVPQKEDYPPMTARKRTANWMSHDLMESIKPADGGKMKCKLCHTDDNGKPVAKILGYPRDVKKAMTWMNNVMVNKFVTLDGEKLKCKACHQANYGQPGFQTKIILTENLPPHAVAGAKPPPI